MLVVYEDVFVPWERVFMCGEVRVYRALRSERQGGRISTMRDPARQGLET